jgi:hypothetical protein
VGGLHVVGDLERIDVPDSSERLHMLVVLPVAEAGQVSVAPGLPRVLSRGLAVHLQDARPRPPEHATHEMNVVDLAGGGRSLMGLIHTLEHGGEQPLGLADDPCGLAYLLGRHAADLRRPLGRPALRGLDERRVAHRVGGDVLVVDPAVFDKLLEQGVEQGDVGSTADREVHVGLPGHGGRAGIDAHELRWVGPAATVEYPHPGDRLSLGHVVPVEDDRVGVVDVGVGAGLAVAAEALL